MALSKKIKHIKRHLRNRRIAKLADDIHFAAAECYLNNSMNLRFIVSPRTYYIINVRRGYVPGNVKNSWLCSDNCVITFSV